MATHRLHSPETAPAVPMPHPVFPCDIAKAQVYLHNLIHEQADAQQRDWLEQQQAKIEVSPSPRALYLAFGSASRHFRKTPLSLLAAERLQADVVRTGLQPQHWNLLQAVRVYFLLMLPMQDKERFLALLGQLLETADMDEQQAVYAALPLLPYPDALVPRAREGLRTNIVSVFDAIALHNPYAADFLPEDAWNQMLLKAIFLGRPLYRIYGADERANRKLAAMLVDFAHERRAAGRSVTPELWRFVAPFMEEATLEDVEAAIHAGSPLEKEAALLACRQSGIMPLSGALPAPMKSWDQIGEAFHAAPNS